MGLSKSIGYVLPTVGLKLSLLKVPEDGIKAYQTYLFF